MTRESVDSIAFGFSGRFIRLRDSRFAAAVFEANTQMPTPGSEVDSEGGRGSPSTMLVYRREPASMVLLMTGLLGVAGLKGRAASLKVTPACLSRPFRLAVW
jgi:hypothetical protein